MIAFDQDTCSDFETALSKEWLETNGRGGFSSSTLISCNTRRYHGLLIAAAPPPLDRMLMVNALDEWVILDGTRYDLSCHQYPGILHPRGYQYLIAFRIDPWPRWTYRVGSVILEKSLTMIQSQNTVICTYRLRKDHAEAELVVRPFLTGRNFHALHQENSALNPKPDIRQGLVTLAPYPGIPLVYFHHNARDFVTGFNWYRQMEYVREKERGLADREDCWSPGEFHFDLRGGQEAILTTTTEGAGYFDAAFLLEAERQRRTALLSGWEATDDVTQHLVLAADQFLIKHSAPETPVENSSFGICAGYPWFEEWGRDAMIALPGLLLVTGRFPEARAILKAYAAAIQDGLLPNRWTDGGKGADYNSVDASLWYILTVFHYLRYTKDFDFVQKQLWPKLKEIIAAYQNGTRYGIHMDLDGLLFAVQPGQQLTWMDAKIGDWVVTPRHGKPIEIQALWYNALRIMEQIGNRVGEKDTARTWGGLAGKVWSSINHQFWNEEGGCLYDVIHGHEKDASVRPNQIFAVSLPFDSVTPDRAERIVTIIEDRLLTPFGLRTLDPLDTRYAPHYEGDVRARDTAYHQGTVWPWLMGPFLTAYQKVHGKSPRVQSNLRAHMALLLTHLWEAGLGTISEIFDGDMPHDPRGCIAQAWSVAEVLRVLREELGNTTPAQAPRAPGRDPLDPAPTPR